MSEGKVRPWMQDAAKDAYLFWSEWLRTLLRCEMPVKTPASELVNECAKIIAAHAPSPSEAYERGVRDAANKAHAWAASTSCKHHEDNPCCHVRTGAGIEAAILALLQANPHRGARP